MNGWLKGELPAPPMDPPPLEVGDREGYRSKELHTQGQERAAYVKPEKHERGERRGKEERGQADLFTPSTDAETVKFDNFVFPDGDWEGSRVSFKSIIVCRNNFFVTYSLQLITFFFQESVEGSDFCKVSELQLDIMNVCMRHRKENKKAFCSSMFKGFSREWAKRIDGYFVHQKGLWRMLAMRHSMVVLDIYI